jgi:hypothetical protein
VSATHLCGVYAWVTSAQQVDGAEEDDLNVVAATELSSGPRQAKSSKTTHQLLMPKRKDKQKDFECMSFGYSQTPLCVICVRDRWAIASSESGVDEDSEPEEELNNRTTKRTRTSSAHTQTEPALRERERDDERLSVLSKARMRQLSSCKAETVHFMGDPRTGSRVRGVYQRDRGSS